MVHRAVLAGILCGLLAACGQDRTLVRGAALYAENCAICHGGDLRGGGGAGVEGLSGIPSDLTVLAREAGGTFPRGDVLDVIGNYAHGRQTGRIMRPFDALVSDDRTRVRTEAGRVRVPDPQAALLAYLESAQRP